MEENVLKNQQEPVKNIASDDKNFKIVTQDGATLQALPLNSEKKDALSDVERLKNQAEVFGLTNRELNDEFIDYKIKKLFKKFNWVVMEGATSKELKNKFALCKRFGFGSITLVPNKIVDACKILATEKDVKINTVLSYPFGGDMPRTVFYNAKLLKRTKIDGVYLTLSKDDCESERLKLTKYTISKTAKILKNKKFELLVDISAFTQNQLTVLSKLVKECKLKSIALQIKENDMMQFKTLSTMLGDVRFDAFNVNDMETCANLWGLGFDRISSQNAVFVAEKLQKRLKN
ncbi:MAG: hypothetical protein ACI4M6_04425 [Christensenellaceae bacterium]